MCAARTAAARTAAARTAAVGPVAVKGHNHDAVVVAGFTDPAECHGETAFGFRPAPRLGLLLHPFAFVGGQVAHPKGTAGVAGSLDPADSLPDVSHVAAFKGEGPHIDDCFVAEFERGQADPFPRFSAGFGAADYRWYPGVFGGDPQELPDRARPCFVVTERIAAGEHHPGHHPVGHAGLARRRPDDGLVAAQGEVTQRVGVPVPREQRAHPLDVLGGQSRAWFRRA